MIGSYWFAFAVVAVACLFGLWGLRNEKFRGYERRDSDEVPVSDSKERKVVPPESLKSIDSDMPTGHGDPATKEPVDFQMAVTYSMYRKAHKKENDPGWDTFNQIASFIESNRSAASPAVSMKSPRRDQEWKKSS